MRSEQTDAERVEAMLECIDSALVRLCMYAERQTELLEKLVEASQSKRKTSQQSPKFKPPVVEDVRLYVKEIGGSIDPSGFIDYYQARGWKLNNGTPVKDWKACVRTWERNGFSKGPKKSDNEKTGAVL